jgi:molybdate transport system substrate-binding protein
LGDPTPQGGKRCGEAHRQNDPRGDHEIADARGEAPLGIVYETDAKIEPAVKVIGVFPDNTHDPIIYPVALTANANSDAVQYLSFLRTQTAKSIFEKYGFNFLVKPATL